MTTKKLQSSIVRMQCRNVMSDMRNDYRRYTLQAHKMFIFTCFTSSSVHSIIIYWSDQISQVPI
jgi:hypothetical protein